MPNCPTCGRRFSSFSFGSNPASECPECREKRAQENPIATAPATSPMHVRIARAFHRPVVTLTIMGLNALVYVAMGVSGVSWTEPSTVQAIRWGADFGPLTLNAEPWRLLTSTFVHFGIVHIGLNMWCLYNLGNLLEPLMGRKRFGVMYTVSGLAASLVSVAWNPWRVSAGASGAIFGVAGALVTYLAMKKTSLDRGLVRQNLRSLAFFIGYNLLYGLSGAVDNSAHLGGLVTGLILGAIIPAQSRPAFAGDGQFGGASSPPAVDIGIPRESSADPAAWNIALGSAVLLILGFFAVRNVNIPAVHYGKAVRLARAGHLDQAADELDKTVTLVPNMYFANALLGEVRLETGNPTAAIPPLEKAFALAQDSDTERNLVIAYLGVGKSKDAMEHVIQILANEKEASWRDDFLEGTAALQMGNYNLASHELGLAIQLKPDFAEAQAAMAALPSAGKPYSPPIPFAPNALPYSTLVIKSDAWPYYP